MSDYKVWSSDSHIMEPADLWTERIDKKFKDRARASYAKASSTSGIVKAWPSAILAQTSRREVRFEDPEKLARQGVIDTVRPGGLDPDAHVKDMDLDGVSGGVLYPSEGLTLWQVPSSDLLSAVFRAYNDYLCEFCSPHPNRSRASPWLTWTRWRTR